MTGLSRDAAHANQTLSPIFDKEKEQNRLATAQKIGEIGRQVSDVLVMQGKLNAQAARAKLIAGGKAIITNTITNGKELLIAAGASVAGSAAIQYGVHGEVKLSDVIGAGVIGAITAGKGYNPTVTWNAAGGYYQAELKGDDPFLGALLSKAGAATGYAAGNILKVPADKIFNPVSKQYEWIPTGVWTISKPVPQSSVPSVAANVANSTVSGLSSYATSDKNGEAKK
nr:hypothetical protein [Klebsiella aerogenes]